MVVNYFSIKNIIFIIVLKSLTVSLDASDTGELLNTTNLQSTLSELNPVTNINLTRFFLEPQSLFNNSIVHTKCVMQNFSEIARECGLRCEEFDVVSDDGYITTMFHIVNDNDEPEPNSVLVLHGLLDTSSTYILSKEDSIAYNLAKAGYDVWAPNCRGNDYGRRHTSLNPNEKAFWNFTFHDIATKDLPAHIDFVLNKTGLKKINYIGHSQGTEISFIMASLRPEYNDKINLCIALAPIAYMSHTKPIGSILFDMWPATSVVLGLVGKEEIFGKHNVERIVLQQQCSQSYGYDLCAKGIYFPLCGYDPEELEEEFFYRANLMCLIPAGTSNKNINHYAKNYLRKRFAQYDYGAAENLIRYGNVNPPEYPLEKVTMRVALIAAYNDNLSTLEDVALLRARLPNVTYYHVMERKKYNHLNFVWGKSLKTQLWPILRELLAKYRINN